jgi:hypothetical protein
MLTVATCENIRRFNLRMVNGRSILNCRVSLMQKLQADVNEGSDDLAIRLAQASHEVVGDQWLCGIM